MPHEPAQTRPILRIPPAPRARDLRDACPTLPAGVHSPPLGLRESTWRRSTSAGAAARSGSAATPVTGEAPGGNMVTARPQSPSALRPPFLLDNPHYRGDERHRLLVYLSWRM